MTLLVDFTFSNISDLSRYNILETFNDFCNEHLKEGNDDSTTQAQYFVMTLLAGVFVACNGEVDSGVKDSNMSKSSVTNGKNGDSGTAYQQEVLRANYVWKS